MWLRVITQNSSSKTNKTQKGIEEKELCTQTGRHAYHPLNNEKKEKKGLDNHNITLRIGRVRCNHVIFADRHEHRVLTKVDAAVVVL